MSQSTLNPDDRLVDSRPSLDRKPHKGGAIAFFVVLAAGLSYAAFSIVSDVNGVGETNIAIGAIILLGLALLVALGFEFVNGFHDTANAVATVIYTHALSPMVAVVWSGFFNFLGVVTSSGAVAFTVVNLLPVELILQAGSSAGYAMIFALLIAAVIWNLGTWAFGLPNSSSHALIGSIMGVGLANQWMAPAGQATSGVDWNQAYGVFRAPAVQPGDRLRARRRAAARHEARDPLAEPLQGARRQQAAAARHPRPVDPDLHRRVLLRTAPTTGRRAWA